MRTRKGFSTISYNTPDFLKHQLQTLVDDGTIDFWAFIKHKAEKKVLNPLSGELEDEGSDHIHLFVLPNKMMDTGKFARYLDEPDPLKPTMPLGIISCRPSKETDWILYCLHDPQYLAMKNLNRTYHYKIDEMISSNARTLEQLHWDAMHTSSTSEIAMVTKMILTDQTGDLLKSGYINLNNAMKVRALLAVDKIMMERAAWYDHVNPFKD